MAVSAWTPQQLLQDLHERWPLCKVPPRDTPALNLDLLLHLARICAESSSCPVCIVSTAFSISLLQSIKGCVHIDTNVSWQVYLASFNRNDCAGLTSRNHRVIASLKSHILTSLINRQFGEIDTPPSSQSESQFEAKSKAVWPARREG